LFIKWNSNNNFYSAANVNDPLPLEKMVKEAKKLTPEEALGVMRTFSLSLNMVNSAEVQHRLRNIREYSRDAGNVTSSPLPNIEDSMKGTMDILLSSKSATKEEIFNQILTQKVELVLTAHPTEVSRRSLLRKYRGATEILPLLRRPDLHAYEKEEAKSDLRRIISSVWGADEVRRAKPTPQQEASGGIAIVESVLWDAVPAYLRQLDTQCRATLEKRLPIDACPIKFASWIGGDRVSLLF
jgi:phosphoenolpyruvate carboxylase